MVEKDLVECVIALPEKLFYNTGTPGCILILNKNKPGERKDKILFIYAANDFEKLKNMNRLRDEDIERIAQTYHEFGNTDRYARVVPLKKIEENDFNLSVTRYVDVFKDEVQVDISQILGELKALESESRKVESQLKNYLKELGY